MSKRKLRPFMAVDGEGCGRNRHGQQHYTLLRAGPYELFNGGKRLRLADCLEFLCNLPAGPILVGFSFGYDSSQILRDLPAERLGNAEKDKKTGEIVKPGTGIFDDKGPGGEGRSRYTWVRCGRDRYGVEYLPKNYLRVCRMDQQWRAVPKSCRTIYETFGFFQMSFLKALQLFDIGREHWEEIERQKNAREGFQRITQEIRRYNALECELLAELMERFREICHANGLYPATWNGAGKIAASEHARNKTITAVQVQLRTPAGALQFASDAYYGGRFEVPYTGDVPGPIYEYDQNSAYPAAMAKGLPCLLHGKWLPFIGKPPAKSLHVAYVAFSHPPELPLCGLPIRQQDGRLYWPREGQGTYWSVELAAAKRLGARIRYTAGWRYQRNCECQPFDWVEHRYNQRRALGKDAAGYPLKLAINSLYGKLAQRIGRPRWANFIHAGLITATTRAALVDVSRQSPESIVMFATDALFSRVPLRLPIGEKLGQWSAEEPREHLFIVQPGLYWGAKRPKTRGIPESLFREHIPTFQRTWNEWCAITPPDAPKPPRVKIPVPTFVGLRLAHVRGAPETACVWIKSTDPKALREFSFDWTGKRAAVPHWHTRTSLRTDPAPGAPDLVSKPHDGRAVSPFDIDRMELEDTPDPLDLSAPG